LYLPSEHTEKAEALFKNDPEWVAPILWRSEFRNILAGYIRRDTLTLEQAIDLQQEVEGLLSGNEFEVDSSGVLELVSKSDCSAYDCEFICLAIKLNTKLVTADKKLIKAFPQYTISLLGS
jgi:predicted nucleic acid-binding protein